MLTPANRLQAVSWYSYSNYIVPMANSGPTPWCYVTVFLWSSQLSTCITYCTARRFRYSYCQCFIVIRLPSTTRSCKRTFLSLNLGMNVNDQHECLYRIKCICECSQLLKHCIPDLLAGFFIYPSDVQKRNI